MISILKSNCVKLFLSVIPLILGGFSVSWGTSYPFELARPLYVGARALGMGNAFTAVADDVTAGFWNPAGLIQWQGVKIFGATKIYDRRDYAFDPKGIGYSYRGNAFFWGNKIALRVDSGTPDFNYYSFARQLGSYLAIGLSLKFKRKHPANYYQFFGSDFSYDVAILSRPSHRIQIGVLMQNLPLQGVALSNPQKRTITPISFGFAYRRPSIIISTDFVFSPSEIAESEIYFGAEWKFKKYLHLRAGVSETHPTFGLGIVIWALRLDYAWIREYNSDSHFVSAEFKG